MASVSKIVDQRIHPVRRYQSFTQADFSAGDICQIETSLGKPAKYVHIETDLNASLVIRLNSQFASFNQRDPRLNANLQPNDISSEQTVTDDTQRTITISGNEVWELENIMPVGDIQLVSFSGTFTIFVA